MPEICRVSHVHIDVSMAAGSIGEDINPYKPFLLRVEIVSHNEYSYGETSLLIQSNIEQTNQDFLLFSFLLL